MRRKKVQWIGEHVLYYRTTLMLLTVITFVEQDVELGQLRQVVCQLKEEKEKASRRAEKLAEELEG